MAKEIKDAANLREAENTNMKTNCLRKLRVQLRQWKKKRKGKHKNSTIRTRNTNVSVASLRKN